MAGIEGPAIKGIEHGAVGSDNFHERTELGFKEVALNRVDRAVNPGRTGSAAHSDIAEEGADFLRGHNRNHVRGDSLHRPRRWISLWRHDSWGEAMMQISIKILRRFRRGPGVARGLGISRTADGREALAIHIAPHAQGLTGAGHRKI